MRVGPVGYPTCQDGRDLCVWDRSDIQRVKSETKGPAPASRAPSSASAGLRLTRSRVLLLRRYALFKPLFKHFSNFPLTYVFSAGNEKEGAKNSFR